MTASATRPWMDYARRADCALSADAAFLRVYAASVLARQPEDPAAVAAALRAIAGRLERLALARRAERPEDR